jgi:hypothetical protein
LNSRLEAAPTESLSNGNLDFPDKQENKFSHFSLTLKFISSPRFKPESLRFEKIFFCKSYVKGGLPRLTPVGCPYKILA